PLPLIDDDLSGYLPYTLELLLDDAQAPTFTQRLASEEVAELTHTFSQTIDAARLPAEGILSLILSSPRLGTDRLLQVWRYRRLLRFSGPFEIPSYVLTHDAL